MIKKLFKMFLWLVGLVLVLGLGLMAYFFIMGRDITPADDSDLRIVEQPVLDSENTYVAFLAVTNLYALSGDDATVCTTYRQWRRDGVANVMIAHTNEWRATVDRVLADNAPYFGGLHKAVALPEYRFVKERTEFGWVAVPPITDMMRANNLWTTKAMREIDRRDYNAALETVRDHLAFGGKVADHAVSIFQLFIGIGIKGCACESARLLAADEGVPEDVLVALADMVRAGIDMQPAFAHAVKGEYMRISDALRDNEIALESILPFLIEEPIGARWFCRMPGYRRFSLQPGATRQLHAETIRKLLRGEDAGKSMCGPCTFLVPNWAGRLLTRTNFSVGLEKDVKQRLLRAQLARVIIAMQRFRRKHGAYPQTLEELVPQYLESAPDDPFAPGRMLNYSAERKTIWSVGKDGDFDPFAAKKDYKFNRNMSMYALRLERAR